MKFCLFDGNTLFIFSIFLLLAVASRRRDASCVLQSGQITQHTYLTSKLQLQR